MNAVQLRPERPVAVARRNRPRPPRVTGTIRLGGLHRKVKEPMENVVTFEELRREGAPPASWAHESLALEIEDEEENTFDDLVGESVALRHALSDVQIVAATDSTVLIDGETGTGKERIARAVHNRSARRSRPLVTLNCAALPASLLEAELFGHERGAFTGATGHRIGRFEAADGGSIFLDEIGELPLESQPKLLRVLQEREFERLGSARTLRTNVRVIAATNRDLKALVQEGRFRQDLYYRLNVFPVHVPPLRERAEDIPLLVRHFARQFSRRYGRRIEVIPAECMAALVRYRWPGNVRELQNVIERAVILSRGPALLVRISELEPRSGAPAPATLQALRHSSEEMERAQIMRALEASNWILAGPKGAAARLGVKRTTLQSRMQRLGIRLLRTQFHEAAAAVA
jgi:formate hydrogenlyase transcriptional activator